MWQAFVSLLLLTDSGRAPAERFGGRRVLWWGLEDRGAGLVSLSACSHSTLPHQASWKVQIRCGEKDLVTKGGAKVAACEAHMHVGINKRIS